MWFCSQRNDETVWGLKKTEKSVANLLGNEHKVHTQYDQVSGEMFGNHIGPSKEFNTAWGQPKKLPMWLLRDWCSKIYSSHSRCGNGFKGINNSLSYK